MVSNPLVVQKLLALGPSGSHSLAVYCALAKRANRDGECWPSIRTLCADTSRCPRGVKEALAYLRQMGAIASERCNGRRSSTYRLLYGEPVPVPTPPEPESKDHEPHDERDL